jgi:hypothetical protein
MLKSIISQIWNRKRSNTWIAIELLLVFCLVWYMVDYFFVLNYNYNLPNHRDISHTWEITLGEYPPQHAKFKAEENLPEAKLANYNRILRQLEDYPGVEALSVVFYGGTPGSGNYNGEAFARENDTTLHVGGQVITFDPGRDYFRVFRLTSGGGKEPLSARDLDWSDPNAIVVSQSVAQQLYPDGSAIGKRIERMERELTGSYHTIVGVVDDVKRFDYLRPQNMYYRSQRLDTTNMGDVQISIRSSASLSDAAFAESIRKDMPNALQIGNYYFKKILSYPKIKEESAARFGQTNDVRMRAYLMAFFLLNILLCVMGAFWYRINLRRSEIGLRKALGSTGRNIRNLFFLEGLVLLAAAAIMAMVVELQFVKADLIETLGQDRGDPVVYLPDRTTLRFLITNAITVAILAIVILAAIWLPAKRAASIPPVEALHDE